MIMDVNTYGMIIVAIALASIALAFVIVKMINRAVNLPTKVDFIIGGILSAVFMFYLYGFMF